MSSLRHVHNQGYPFVFTDRHAYPVTARYFNDLNQLPEIDWPLLQMRNFQRNPNDPEQIERYQAEALIYQHLPVSGLLGIVCYTDELKLQLEKQIMQLGFQLDIHRLPGWYF